MKNTTILSEPAFRYAALLIGILLWNPALPTSAFAAGTAVATAIEPDAVLNEMERVADWQLANPSRHDTTDWTQGAGYAGIMALAGVSGDSAYRDAMVAMGE